MLEYKIPLNKTFLLLLIFFETKAVTVIFVAKEQGLIALFKPNTKADNKGILYCSIGKMPEALER